MPRDRPRRQALTEFLSVEALSGIVLLAATIGALAWANIDLGSYSRFWATELSIGSLTESLGQWINDGLMAVFFFVVGLEIKRELVVGELRDRRTAALPAIAAVGGMVVPALFFLAFNAGTGNGDGWGVAIATDIAFAVAVLAVLGTRVPPGLRLFLLTLAIADDIGAVVVIAVVYAGDLEPMWFVGAGACIAVILGLRAARVPAISAYMIPGAALWLCVLESGVHATVAGVVLGLLTPARPVRNRPVLEQLEHRLHPWSSVLIVPLFALANAGVPLGASALGDAASSAVAWGAFVGLVVGKPVGIVAATAAGMRLRLGRLPEGVRGVHVLGAGAVAGIGFTVALFVAGLAFTGSTLDEVKVGVLAASLVSGLAGAAILVFVGWSPRVRSSDQ